MNETPAWAYRRPRCSTGGDTLPWAERHLLFCKPDGNPLIHHASCSGERRKEKFVVPVGFNLIPVSFEIFGLQSSPQRCIAAMSLAGAYFCVEQLESGSDTAPQTLLELRGDAVPPAADTDAVETYPETIDPATPHLAELNHLLHFITTAQKEAYRFFGEAMQQGKSPATLVSPDMLEGDEEEVEMNSSERGAGTQKGQDALMASTDDDNPTQREGARLRYALNTVLSLTCHLYLVEGRDGHMNQTKCCTAALFLLRASFSALSSASLLLNLIIIIIIIIIIIFLLIHPEETAAGSRRIGAPLHHLENGYFSRTGGN
eukprot:gene7085-5020_t